MKTIKFLAIILLVLSTVSCSSDDDTNTNENNYVKVGNTTFGMTSATVESSFNRTYIELINKTEAEVLASINNGFNLNSLDYMSITINENSIGELTYDFNDILDYEFFVNGSVVNGELEVGVIQLQEGESNNLYAVSGSVTITYYSVDRIAFTFNFEREDGTMITGSFDGGYIFLEDSLD